MTETRITRRASCKRWTYKGRVQYIPVIIQNWPERNHRIHLNTTHPSAQMARTAAQAYINDQEQ